MEVHRKILLSQGLLVDGTGRVPSTGSLLLSEGKIVAIGNFEAPAEAQTIDCRGLVIAPGFIDGHSHSDLQVLASRPEKLLQGVTAEVVGNCGFSPYPCGTSPELLREFANGILCGEGVWGWENAGDYLDRIRELGVSGVYSLIGHGSLRVAFAGMKNGPVSRETLERMTDALEQAFAQGAIGFSTGLMYAPGSEAPQEELELFCSLVARHNKIYCTHMRDYGFHLLEAIDEQLLLAKKTGCRLQISHLQAVGRANRELNARALDRIEAARAEGIDVAFDCYPYIAGSTVMTQLLPQWALEGGNTKLLMRLSDSKERERIAEAASKHIANDWSELLVSAVGSEDNQLLVGRSLEEIARQRGITPIEAVFNLLREENCQVNILEFNQSEENLRANLTHPLSLVISDGFYVKGRPHPRLHGTFAKWLGHYCRDLGWISLSEAVRKVTGFPAERFGLKECGFLREGYRADVTVFDAESIASPATYEDPERAPQGVRYVFTSGELRWLAADLAQP